MQKQCKSFLEILRFPVRNENKNMFLNHIALGHDCSLKNKARWVAQQMFVCRTHTHTEMTFKHGLDPNMSPTRTEIPQLFSGKKHSTNNVFYKCFLTLGYRVVQYWPRICRRGERDILAIRRFLRRTSRCDEDSKEDWAVVLDSWYG